MKHNKIANTFNSGAVALTVFTGFGIATSPVQAQAVSCGTLFDLLDQNQTCQVGDKEFNNWTLFGNPDGVNLNNITVNGIFPDTNAPGLEFISVNNELSINTGSINLNFAFLVTSLGEPIVDNELLLVDAAAVGDITGGTSTVLIEESVGTSLGSADIAFKDAFIIARGGGLPPGVPPREEKLFDRTEFAPQQSIWISKNIFLEAEGVEGFASLDTFQQRFSQQTPEPTSVLGLLALGGLGLKLKCKKEE